MKEITVISGKGGTGKTSITATLADLINDLVITDCDVDAANLALILKSENKEKVEFIGGKKAQIDNSKCTSCGKCVEVCEFNSISVIDDVYNVKPFSCEGCGACYHFCPSDAILFEDVVNGNYFVDTTKDRDFYHAELYPGEENSGKLVVTLKNKAKRSVQDGRGKIVLNDGSPGTGCAVIASISGSDYVVLVTEPTFSGLHDLERVVSLCRRFEMKMGICINKFDINDDMTKKICDFAKKQNIEVISKLPFSKDFVYSMIQGVSVYEMTENLLIKKEFDNMCKSILKSLEE
ncbi:MAG: ATP-binding protein [Candidatus Muirbacterium halophilum]|nr:ATP-binding protein [Candidatus Muirbacterium halophilum]MCK9476013.1 ATP-binding protein [Candidatus Muirbacterium halophilum]